MRIVLALVAVALLIAGYFWLVLTWSYSTGERAGWIQELSKKGWVCKTWEGELAMVSMPGATPEKFYFTVRDHAVAQRIAPVMGKRVTAPLRGKGWAPDLLLRQDQVFRYPGDGRRREPAGARRHRDRAAAGAAKSGLPEELSS